MAWAPLVQTFIRTWCSWEGSAKTVAGSEAKSWRISIVEGSVERMSFMTSWTIGLQHQRSLGLLGMATEGEDLLDEVAGPAPGLDHRRQVVLQFSIVRVAAAFVVVEDEAGVAENDGEDIVEIVRDAAGQHSYSLHLLRLLELLGELPSPRDVAHGRDKNVAPCSAPIVQRPRTAHLVDGDLERKSRPIAAPAFDLTHGAEHASIAGVEILGDEGLVLFGVRVLHQGRHVAAEHVGGRVVEDSLGCGVECLYRAVGVEGHHAVDHGLDDRQRLLLVDSPNRFAALELGDVGLDRDDAAPRRCGIR